MNYKIFDLDKEFILSNINQLIQLEDYVPFDFRVYGFQKERDGFLESRGLLKTMREMDDLLNEKCKHYQHPILAHDSIMIEWLICHPEFERIISAESISRYYALKNSSNFIEFIDLLYDVELISEKDSEFNKVDGIDELLSVKDDSNIKYPDFNEKRKCFEEYPNTLISCYLSYLI